MLPDWLPPKLNLNNVSLQADYDELFAVFERDFINKGNSIVDGSIVINDKTIDQTFGDGNYTYGFTHLITIGKEDRRIDYDRARKLPWVRAILDNYKKPDITAFYVDRPKESILYLWLVEFDFVVILKKLRSKKELEINNKIIVTAYHLQNYGKNDMKKLLNRASKCL